MFTTCIALCLLGYQLSKDYKLSITRKLHEDALRRKQYMKLYQKELQKTRNNFLPSDRLPIASDRSIGDSQIADTQTTIAPGKYKYHQGSCRLSCHIKRQLQELCPRRPSLRNEPKQDVSSGQAQKERSPLILGGIGAFGGMLLWYFHL